MTQTSHRIGGARAAGRSGVTSLAGGLGGAGLAGLLLLALSLVGGGCVHAAKGPLGAPQVEPGADEPGAAGESGEPPGNEETTTPARGLADADALADRERMAPRMREEAPPLLPAAAALLDRAERARSGGDLAAALTHAERAQRIAPRAPEVYLALARIHLESGSRGRAEQLARKAAQLAGGATELRRAAKKLIERARAGS